MVLKNYRPLNTERILKQLHKVQSEAEEVEVSSQPQTPSTEHRRRQSMMDNPYFKYAFSRKKWILHDRDCSFVEHIPDEDFDMLKEFDIHMTPCSACYRSMLIRSVVENQPRKIRLYEKAFDKIGCNNKRLRNLLIDNKAQLIDVDPFSLTIKVKEDTWLLQFYSDKLELFHNNYTINDDLTRTFTPGFHFQNVYNNPKHYCIAFNEMISYSWKAHLQNIDGSASASYYEELKESFSTVLNYKQVKESKYHITFQFVDYNYQALRFIAERGIIVNLRGPLPCRYICQDEPFSLLQCRVKRNYVSAFTHALKLLKEHAYSKKAYEYIEVCQML